MIANSKDTQKDSTGEIFLNKTTLLAVLASKPHQFYNQSIAPTRFFLAHYTRSRLLSAQYTSLYSLSRHEALSQVFPPSYQPWVLEELKSSIWSRIWVDVWICRCCHGTVPAFLRNSAIVDSRAIRTWHTLRRRVAIQVVGVQGSSLTVHFAL